MTNRLTFKDRDLALGLTWLPPGAHPAGISAARKQRELHRLKPAPAGFVEINTRDGVQTGMSYDESQTGLSSAAAVLAHQGATLVLIEPLDENLYWLCALESGAIWPAGDLTGTYNQVRARLAEIMQDMENPAVYDPDRSFDIDSSDPVGFDDLVDELPEGLQINPLRRRSIPKPVRWGLGAAAMVAAVYVAWNNFHADRPDPQPSAELAQQRAQAERQKELERFEQALQQDSVRLMAGFVEAAVERPLRSGGWQQTQYEWVPGTLTAVWTNERGTIGSLAETLPPGSWTMNESSGQIIETIEFAAPLKTARTDLEQLLERSDPLDILDQIASLRGRWVINPPALAGTHYKVKRSALTASGLRVDTLANSVAALADAPFRITRLEWTLAREYEIVLEGEFYESHR